MHRAAAPALRQLHLRPAAAPRRPAAQHTLPAPGAVGVDIHLVAATASSRSEGDLHLQRRSLPPLLRAGNDTLHLDGRRLAVAHDDIRPRHRHAPIVAKSETALVHLHEEVALRHMLTQAHAAQPLAQRALHASRQGHHLLEKHTVGLLTLRARVAHRLRPRPQAPFATPLVADDRAHRPAVGIVDSITLLCHTN
ncbi:MAG: hypothetical protein IJ745_01330 [Bacteroidales bacterium]|nr:hypothetical protein [Bacteroidales bacterium]